MIPFFWGGSLNLCVALSAKKQNRVVPFAGCFLLLILTKEEYVWFSCVQQQNLSISSELCILLLALSRFVWCVCLPFPQFVCFALLYPLFNQARAFWFCTSGAHPQADENIVLGYLG